MCLVKETKNVIKSAIEKLESGKLVSIMAETVYGLAVDASNTKAINLLYKTKNRSKKNPLIIHVDSIKMSESIGILDKDFYKLAKTFWPGPLTIIVKKKKSAPLSEVVNSKLDTVGIRIPNSKIFLKIINKLKKPIAAPSANLSGYISSTRAQHVLKSFGDKISLIIDSGKCKFGLESTIVNLSEKPYKIERLGIISKREIYNKTGINFIINNHVDQGKIISPGQMLKHYSPKKPIRLNAKKPNKNEAFLCFGLQRKNYRNSLNLSKKGCLKEAAFNLFDFLQQLDETEKTKIAISKIPNKGIGVTINERLTRANVKT